MLSRSFIIRAVFSGAIAYGFLHFYETAKQKRAAEELAQINASLKTHLEAFTELNKKNNRQTIELLAAQQAVKHSLSAQQRETQRLQNEVQEIKEWADNALPADIIRLRQRSAFTGASAYSERLPSSDTMRVEPQQPEN